MTADAVDLTHRPPALEHVTNAYGVYVEGDSMRPRFRPGELIYVHPHRPVAPGDYVLVAVRRDRGGEALWHIGELVERGPSEVVIGQHNPPKRQSFAAESVDQIHKILTTNDLFGV